MVADVLVKPMFEMHADPFHSGPFTDLRDNSFEFGIVFTDRAGILVHRFNSKPEAMGIISTGEACLKGHDKLVEGRKLGS